MPPGTGPSSLLRKHETKFRFILVGAWNTIFGYLAFVLLDELLCGLFSNRRLAYMVAMVLANIIAILNAFFFHRTFTFQSRVSGLAVLGELIRFSSTYLFTFLLSLFLLPVFVELLRLSTKVAAALIILVCTVISYLGHSRYSFRKTSP
ncbi:MAG: GtrA family protein [Thermodesulfobacteriota bacterium]